MARGDDDNVTPFPGMPEPKKSDLSTEVRELMVTINQAGLTEEQMGELIGALTIKAIGSALSKGLGDMGIDL